MAPGATDALLCAYSTVGAGEHVPLTRARPLSGDVAGLVSYLNGLPEQAPAGSMCLLSQQPMLYTIVFGYTDRAPEVASHGCGWDHAGAVRHQSSLAAVLRFWGLQPNE